MQDVWIKQASPQCNMRDMNEMGSLLYSIAIGDGHYQE